MQLNQNTLQQNLMQKPPVSSTSLQPSNNNEDNTEFKSCLDQNNFYNSEQQSQKKEENRQNSQSQFAKNYGHPTPQIDQQQETTSNKPENQNQQYITFDHVLSKIGIGLYQYLFYIIMATLGLTEGAQVSVFTIMIPILKNEWNVQEETNTIQVCLVFVGFLLGSVISGQFADRYGRKKPFVISSFCTAIFTILQAFTTNIVQLIILRFFAALLVGFFGPLGVTLLAEITPLEVRGRFMSLVTVSFAIGQLYGQFVSYFTLESLSHGNWRLLIIFTGFPGVIAWLMGVFFLDESGRYALMDGKYEQAYAIINKINRINGNRMEELDEEQKEQLKQWSVLMNKQFHQSKGSLICLFQNEGKVLTPLIWFNWFTLSFMYYGVLTLMPKMMEELDRLHPKKDGSQDFSDIVKLALSTITEMVSACIASYLIEIKGLGRKNSMIICYTLQGICSLVVYLDAGNHFVIWASGCKFFLSMTFIFTYQFTAEIYSTKIRTTGVGMANGIGRSGGGVMPWVTMILQKTDIFLPFLLFTCLSFLTGLIDFVIPYDTLGRELDVPDQEEEVEEEKNLQ